MLGQTLVTKQTGPAGKPVNTLYVARKMKLKREMYFAILLDRKTAGPVMIGCRLVPGVQDTGSCNKLLHCTAQRDIGQHSTAEHGRDWTKAGCGPPMGEEDVSGGAGHELLPYTDAGTESSTDRFRSNMI